MGLISLLYRNFNKSVLMTMINYGSKLVFKFLLILLIPLFLNDSQMGYWYTFGSIAALSTFADLGFTTIITQFSAHENAYISFDEKKHDFTDSNEKIGKISSLFRFSIKWSSIVTFVCSIVILLIGILVFMKDSQSNVEWIIPWIIYSISSALNFFTQVVLAFFEGCNQIVVSQRIKLIDGILVNGLGILGLFFGLGLYSLSIPLMVSTFVVIIQILFYYRKVIIRMIKCKIIKDNIWVKDVLKLLWKYAISWGSGYLIFQIYNPIVFAIYGSESAGKVGYVLTIITAFVSIANIWSYVSVPKINLLVEKKEWKKLDKVFNNNIILIEVTFVFEILLFILVSRVPILDDFISKYVFSMIALIIISIGYFFQLFVSYCGVYLRAHKQEPLMILSLVTAIISIVLTVIFIYTLTLDFVFLGFSISVTLSSFVAFMIMKHKKLQWHSME